MNPLLSAVDKKLLALPVQAQLILPDGTRLGSDQPTITLSLRDKKSLAHLASGDVGLLGQDYVEGRVDIDGRMRDLMDAASALLPGSPVEAAKGSQCMRCFLV